MKLAPARITCRAVSASSTVPAPSRSPFGRSFASCSMRPTAPGTVIVTSIAVTPPAMSASATDFSLDGSFIRMTATTPEAATSWTTCRRDMAAWSSVDLGRRQARHEQVDDGERRQVREAGDQEDADVAPGPLQDLADDQRQHHAADRTGHPAEADDRSDGAAREHVGHQ